MEGEIKIRPPFPRGSGPLCSILLPSRNRVRDLAETIDSVWSLAENKDNLEFIVKVDDDDSDSIDLLEKLKKVPNLNLTAIISPQGNGYADFHLWVNQMCSISKGDWLLLINDDSRLETQDWDTQFRDMALAHPWFGCWHVCLLCAKTKGITAAKQFPCLRRKTYEILGHFSLSPHNDTWITGVLDFLRMNIVDVPFFEFTHLEKEKKDSVRETSLKKMYATLPTIHSLKAKREIQKDVIVVLDYLDALWEKSLWFDRPNRPGWYYWDIDGGEGKLVFASWNMSTYKIELTGFEQVKIDCGRLTFVNEGYYQ